MSSPAQLSINQLVEDRPAAPLNYILLLLPTNKEIRFHSVTRNQNYRQNWGYRITEKLNYYYYHIKRLKWVLFGSV